MLVPRGSLADKNAEGLEKRGFGARIAAVGCGVFQTLVVAHIRAYC